MCIRDSTLLGELDPEFRRGSGRECVLQGVGDQFIQDQPERCLLYTSDAADERSSVDLGGRRIIKKKKKKPLPQGNILRTTEAASLYLLSWFCPIVLGS